MKVVVISGSRSDKNGLEAVLLGLRTAGHSTELLELFDFNDPHETAAAAIQDCAMARSELALVAGDRFEVLAAALALSLHGIPIAHLAGGDITTGSQDDRYRDCLTALACVHLTTNMPAYERVRKIARPSDSLYLTGSPALDAIRALPCFDKDRTFRSAGLRGGTFGLPALLVSVHPNTGGKLAEGEAIAISDALNGFEAAVIWIGANADPGAEVVNRVAERFCSESDARIFQSHLPANVYYSLMRHCDVMLGNSSAGFYEAPYFSLPVVNVGERQNGRVQPDNVRTVPADPAAIRDALNSIKGSRIECRNPYGDANAVPAIVLALEENAWRIPSATANGGRR